jgi:4-aminobutyrate aminotransferase-like enzyme
MPAAKDAPAAALLPAAVEGYDLAAERGRYGLAPEGIVRGHRLHRGTARVAVAGMESPAHAAVRARHAEVLFPNTLAPDSPVVELGWPLSGSFVRCAAGVYLDMYLGVGQKLLDPNHAAIRAALEPLLRLDLLTRREINTDDFLVSAEGCEGLRTPQDLASLAGSLAAEAFPGTGPWKCFLSNSGTEAVEAGVKIAWQVRYKRFLEAHGFDVLERVARDLGIGRSPLLAEDRSRPEPLLADYPFFVIACASAFHGRTLGSLQFTASKRVQRVGYPMTRWARHVPFNGDPAAVAALIDPRPIAEILAAPGGVRAVVEAGRIPRDLLAGFLVEPFQGEGGYRPADPAWLRAVAGTVQGHGGLLVLDEVQSFGRTGTLFFAEQLGVSPDVVLTAKGAVVGITLARAALAPLLHGGWHSNTWGGGKILDNQWAWAVLDALRNHRDPVLGGLSYAENCRVKGAYAEAGLRILAERHPGLVEGFDHRGLLLGLSVRRRADVIRVGWARGLKLLGCGLAGEVSRLRILFLADAVANEVEEFVRVMDEVLAEVAATPAPSA